MRAPRVVRRYIWLLVICLPLFIYLFFSSLLALQSNSSLTSSPHQTHNLQANAHLTISNKPAQEPVFGLPRVSTGTVTASIFQVPETGALGNKLFRYASMYGIARRSNRTVKLFPDDSLWKVFVGIDAGVQIECNHNYTTLWEKHPHKFSPELMELPVEPDVAICCYLKSWKYFEDYKTELKRQLVFHEHYHSKAREMLHRIKEEYLESASFITSQNNGSSQMSHGQFADVTFVGIHARNHDNSGDPTLRGTYQSPSEPYIRNAMRFYQKKFTNVIFVMRTNNHEWCKKTFHRELHNSTMFLMPGGSMYEDMAMLASCDHTIITEGTFGWWAAWLAGGHVTYDKKWPRPGSPLSYRFSYADYYPQDWVPME